MVRRGVNAWFLHFGHLSVRLENRLVVVLWRNAANWIETDFRRDKEFVTKNELTAGADAVYVDDNSIIPWHSRWTGFLIGDLGGAEG